MVNQCFKGGVAWLQVTLFPILLVGWSSLEWRFQFIAALVLSLTLALSQTKLAAGPLLIIAAIVGIIACIGQWTLLPLVAAQVAIGWLLATQTFSERAAASVWLGQSFFLQITLVLVTTRLITVPTILDLLLVTVPFLVSIWADHLPGWLDIVAIVGLVVLGYTLQHLTIVSACGLAVLAVLASERLHRPTRAVISVTAIAAGCLIILTRLHG